MAEITAAMVKELRERTNAGLMDCKKALGESSGNMEEAIDLLRKRGIASAAKKASRAANEGVIAQHILAGAKVGVLVEVNCETDFVAKNESFLAFCDEIAAKLAQDPEVDLESDRTAQVAKIGENIQIARHARLEVKGSGAVAGYIHTGAKVGVLVEVGAEKDESTSTETFKEFVRNITLQIAAANPVAVRRDEINPELIAREKAIAEDQAKDKPPQAIEKIVQGKLEKFYQGNCLVDQGFIKAEGDETVADYVTATGKSLGDNLSIQRFLRFQVGETA